MFDSLGCVRRPLPGVVLRQHVNQTHEVDLPLGGTWRGASLAISDPFARFGTAAHWRVIT